MGLLKAKEYRKIFKSKLEDEVSNVEEYVAKIALDFLREFSDITGTQDINDNKVLNKAKELDIKFQGSIPKELNKYSKIFRTILLKEMPNLKQPLRW